jgi:hypothetical protein
MLQRRDRVAADAHELLEFQYGSKTKHFRVFKSLAGRSGERVCPATAGAHYELKSLAEVLLPGDTVVVTKLDRLARSSCDLHNIVHNLEGLSCGFVSLGESWVRYDDRRWGG